MRERTVARVRAGLFDRLVDDRPGDDEIRPFSTFDRDGLVRALEEELGRLLNTRLALPVDQVRQRERTTIDYGIPDLGDLTVANPDDRRYLADAVREAIRVFEPRLKEVQARVDPYPGRPRSAIVRVRGKIEMGRVPEPVSFILNLDQLN